MNGEAERMTNFNWIKARADCLLAQVFKQLELGARNDVDTANAQRLGSRPLRPCIAEPSMERPALLARRQ